MSLKPIDIEVNKLELEKEKLELEKLKYNLEENKHIFEINKLSSSKFKDLWDSYNKVVILNITLQTAVLAFFINSLSSETTMFSYNKLNVYGKRFSLVIISTICLGVVIGVIWRVLSQIYMEKEVFGNYKTITEYLENQVGYDKHNYYFKRQLKPFWRWLWNISVWCSWIIFICSMTMFGVFYSLALNGIIKSETLQKPPIFENGQTGSGQPTSLELFKKTTPNKKNAPAQKNDG